MLGGPAQGPNYYSPDRHPDRAKDRLAYVLGRMQEDGVINAAQKEQALAEPPKLVAFKIIAATSASTLSIFSAVRPRPTASPT